MARLYDVHLCERQVTFTGWQDVVIWNPWKDMPAAYDHFVCVENVRFAEPVVVKAGDSWRGTTNFQVVDL